MSDVSILEYLPFAVVAYSAVIILLISIIKDIPMSRSMSIARSIYILLGMLCAFAISGMGINITGTTEINIVNATTFNETNDLIFTEITNSTTTTKIVMLNFPLWVIVHRAFGLVMAFFFILQILTLLTKKD